MPNGRPPKAGEILKNPDLARTLRRLVEAEKQASSKGRQAGLKAARDRFYKGDIAREMARFSEESGGLFRYEDFAEYTAKVEEPVSTTYRGYTVYKNPSASNAFIPGAQSQAITPCITDGCQGVGYGGQGSYGHNDVWLSPSGAYGGGGNLPTAGGCSHSE